MTTVKKEFPEIPFAHRVHTHRGHCRFIHGHSWFLEVTFSCIYRDENQFIYDFGGMRIVKEFLGKFDHALVLAANDPLLDKLPELTEFAQVFIVPVPTCEGLAEFFADNLDSIVRQETNNRAFVKSVTLHEGLVNSATYELHHS